MNYYEIKSDIKVYQRNERFLVILSDVPYWLIVGKIGIVVFKYLKDTQRSIQEIEEHCCSKFGYEHKERISQYVNKLIAKLERDHVFDYQLADLTGFAETHKYLIYTAGINITRNCNLRCLYCYANASQQYDGEREVITQQELDKFLEGVKAYASPDCPIQFTGGEPLLRRDLLYYGIKKARELGFTYLTINTNGLLLKKEDIEFFKKYHVDNVTISLDGTNKEKHEKVRGIGSFEPAIKAISMLKQGEIPTTASITIHKDNIDELNSFLLFCKENHVQPFTSPLFPLGRCVCNELESVNLYDIFTRIKEMYESGELMDSDLDGTFLQTMILPLKDLVRRKYCGTGSSTIFLDSNGDVFPCTNTLGPDFFLCGNIREKEFAEIWEHSQTLNFLRNNVTVDEIDGCRSCEIRYICSGYCRGMNYQVTGKIDSQYVWCESIKKCLIESMWFLDEHPEVFKYYKDKFNRYNYADVEKFLFLK